MTPTNMIFEQANISAINFNGYRIELSINLKEKPVARLYKLLTTGKNKGQYKLLKGYFFGNEERRETWVRETITNIKANIQSDELRKAVKKDAVSGHPFKVGDALYASWGYDQTNIDFFEVVDVLPKSVKVRPIGQIRIEGTEGFMCENVKPDLGNYTGEAVTRPIKAFVGYTGTSKAPETTGYYVSNGRHHLSPYTYGDRGVYQSHYA